ncbi:MAG: RNA-binding protein [Candidatus Brocadiae bacterium]|nr:RNA-binding protein [Candidatus Brocadiia bacterium]
MNIYVGNLSFDTNDGTLRAAFEAHGEVTSAQVITDRDTGQSRGFGFVEMPSSQEAQAAMTALDGSDLDGRQIKANEAKPRGDRRGGGGGGGGGGSRRGSW